MNEKIGEQTEWMQSRYKKKLDNLANKNKQKTKRNKKQMKTQTKERRTNGQTNRTAKKWLKTVYFLNN